MKDLRLELVTLGQPHRRRYLVGSLVGAVAIHVALVACSDSNPGASGEAADAGVFDALVDVVTNIIDSKDAKADPTPNGTFTQIEVYEEPCSQTFTCIRCADPVSRLGAPAFMMRAWNNGAALRPRRGSSCACVNWSSRRRKCRTARKAVLCWRAPWSSSRSFASGSRCRRAKGEGGACAKPTERERARAPAPPPPRGAEAGR